MRQNIIISLIGLCVMLTSCELDNYDIPDKILEGMVVDKLTGETIQTRQPDGIKIRLMEEGYTNPVPYDFWTKSDGTFRNTRVFSAKYKALTLEGPFEQSSVEEVDLDLTKNQNITFEVEPYARLLDVSISKTGSGIKATYKISQTNPERKIIRSMLICSDSPIIHQTTTNKLSSEENDLEILENENIYQMSFEDEIPNLEIGRTYYARVAVLTENSLSRFNYSPIIEIEF
ncbi:MAG: DUF3823 domain-containing protein [Cyclobacteriaceae bacterium]